MDEMVLPMRIGASERTTFSTSGSSGMMKIVGVSLAKN